MADGEKTGDGRPVTEKTGDGRPVTDDNGFIRSPVVRRRSIRYV
jgi:hypothetical protein